ncbi:hypothetical protein NW759_002832 [Fusarium solani]|nr:hypothetical protein NW759_002832 [Fusarium solani]
MNRVSGPGTGATSVAGSPRASEANRIEPLFELIGQSTFPPLEDLRPECCLRPLAMCHGKGSNCTLSRSPTAAPADGLVNLEWYIYKVMPWLHLAFKTPTWMAV